MIIISNGDVSIGVDEKSKQLVSINYKGLEYFHGGGAKDFKGDSWGNSEIICFPIFGPAKDGVVFLKGRKFNLGQHGISRHIPFEIVRSSKDFIELKQTYDGQPIKNTRQKQGEPEFLDWFNYDLTKKFSVLEDSVLCEFKLKNTSEEEFPYIIAWHPGFEYKNIGSFFNVEENGKLTKMTGLERVIEVAQRPKNNALRIPREELTTNQILYKEHNRIIRIQSTGFNDYLLWSPQGKPNMFCVEPTTKFPRDNNVYFDDPLIEKEIPYEIIQPGEEKHYSVRISFK